MSGWANSYSVEYATSAGAPEPGRPYATYLASKRGFHFLGFDLDATRASCVAEDAAELRNLLTFAGVTGLVECISGPTGGRHIWAAFAEPIPAHLVAQLGGALSSRLPSLDASPLLNPATGCLRPPGAPHRIAGSSQLLEGDPGWLVAPANTIDSVAALIAELEAVEPTATPPLSAVPHIGRDAEGVPCLIGPRRRLLAVAAAALSTAPGANDDASALLWTSLLGLARARRTYADVVALLPTAPGLEHARTARAGHRRVARGHVVSEQLLTRQWRRAVEYAATHTHVGEDDEEFLARMTCVVETVAYAQARANASPGRWARGGGPCDERVLLALCVLALQAVRSSVEADIRRLGLMAGVSRETARTALLRLADDGWIAQESAASGVRASTWRLVGAAASPSSTASTTDALPQADPRPRRTAWLHRLTTRLRALAHDTFTPAGLGHAVARTWAHYTLIRTPQHHSTTTTAAAAAYASERLGYDSATITGHLEQLERLGWRRASGPAWRDSAAAHLGVTGVLERRAETYASEREAWAWWCAELTWMSAPRNEKRRGHDARQGVLPIGGLDVRERLGRHPRRADGRADFAGAMRFVRETAQGRAAGGSSGLRDLLERRTA